MSIKINYQKFPSGEVLYEGKRIIEGTTEYENLRREHIKQELEDKGIWSLSEVENLEELIEDMARNSRYYFEHNFANSGSSKQFSKLEKEISKNPQYLNLAN